MMERSSASQAHLVSAKALVRAMFELNHCWPHWWELVGAEIRVGGRLIQGPLPEPWQRAGFDVRPLIANQGLLAALNPQPLPPLPRDVAVALEIADRLIGTASLAAALDDWLKRDDGVRIERRLAAEVDDLCPPLVHVVVKPGGHPHPDPGPDPWPIKLSALAQLAMGARFAAATAHAGSGELRTAYSQAGDKLTRTGLSNLDREL
jgi:hypothetical protein